MFTDISIDAVDRPLIFNDVEKLTGSWTTCIFLFPCLDE